MMELGSDLARSGIAIYAVEQAQRSTSGLASRDTLQQLVGLTGGKWFPDGAAEEAIQQAMGEGQAMYQVGYRPPAARWDNKFHALSIAEGKGGVRLRVRAIKGYYGDKREADPQQRYALAAAGQVDASEIGIRATVAPSEKVKGWVHLQARVDADDLRLIEGTTYTGEVRVAFAYYINGWQPDITEEVSSKLNFTSQEHDAILRKGIIMVFDRPVRTGASKVRIIVRDPQSGAVGSLTIPVEALYTQ